MDVKKRLQLVEEVGEEIITREELRALLKKKKKLIAYDGFEPSGKIHIAQAILRTINVNKMIKAGFTFKMLVADWHAWANNKMGGDLGKIQTVGKYFVEVWKASGMKTKDVEFIWVSDLVKKDDYWKLVMQVARHSTLHRVLRTSQIMGRTEKDGLQASQILYPCMQAADIFYLGVDVCQLGMDQRKVNVLARELAGKLGYTKPIIVSHHMLMGLTEPPKGNLSAVEKAIAMKMSKSNPDSAVFVSDTEEEIKRKIKKAYCPAKQVKDNPILEYCRYLIFERFKTLKITRPAKFGGNISIKSYAELEKKYIKGEVHPLDLKNAVSYYINEMVKPIRKHFKKNKKAKKLYETVNKYKVTR